MPDKIQRMALSGIGISLIAGVILSILGPYRTSEFPHYIRLIYWTALSFIGALGAGAFLPLSQKIGRSPNTIQTAIGQSVTASIVVTICLAAMSFYQTGSISLPHILVLFGFVWVIAIVISAIAHMAERSSRPDSVSSNRPDLFNRLKPQYRNADIYALSAEDHYVRVFTSKGEDLILMRLSDAIQEVGTIQGLPVHRSWWVAEAGVKSVKTSEGKITLELISGQIVPVSRSQRKTVKSAGWV